MEILYRKINVPNLKELQDQITTLIPEQLYRSPRVYFPSDQPAFFKIPEIIKLLNLYNLKHSDTTFGFYAMGPFLNGPVHIDWGQHDYSMNIPLVNCNNTFTTFYQPSEEPELVPARTINGTFYNPHYSFSKMKLEKIEQYESNIPCVMHIKTPHSVSNFQPTFRTNLLIRNNNNETMFKILNGLDGRNRTYI